MNISKAEQIRYLKIIEQINKYQYVPFYRTFKLTNSDLTQFKINSNNDSLFYNDSIYYYNARKKFFNQNINLIKWLFRFKKDKSKVLLWREFQNPCCSFFDFQSNKSKSALNLILSYLDGHEISDFRYTFSKFQSKQKYTKLFNDVEEFILKNEMLNLKQLRKKWRWKKHLLTNPTRK
ncbi:MAG: hypothetical protein HYR91_03515 [Flavobacteriia bacterium]|nr:hypothetical protein [Flavobacteriia bacterium]